MDAMSDMYQRRLEKLNAERVDKIARLGALKPHSEARAAIRRDLVKITVNAIRIENHIARQAAIKARQESKPC